MPLVLAFQALFQNAGEDHRWAVQQKFVLVIMSQVHFTLDLSFKQKHLLMGSSMISHNNKSKFTIKEQAVNDNCLMLCVRSEASHVSQMMWMTSSLLHTPQEMLVDSSSPCNSRIMVKTAELHCACWKSNVSRLKREQNYGH